MNVGDFRGLPFQDFQILRYSAVESLRSIYQTLGREKSIGKHTERSPDANVGEKT